MNYSYHFSAIYSFHLLWGRNKRGKKTLCPKSTCLQTAPSSIFMGQKEATWTPHPSLPLPPFMVFSTHISCSNRPECLRLTAHSFRRMVSAHLFLRRGSKTSFGDALLTFLSPLPLHRPRVAGVLTTVPATPARRVGVRSRAF